MSRIIEVQTAVEIADTLAAVAGGDPVCQILPAQNPVARPQMGLVSLKVQLTTAVASAFGLVLPITVGTATAPLTGQKVSINGGPFLPQGLFASAWSVLPTYAGAVRYLRQEYLPAVLGASFEWTWPQDNPLTEGLGHLDLTLVKSKGIVLRNIGPGVTGNLYVTARWLEF